MAADRPPRLVVFAGPNGSGKSTMAEEIRRIDRSFPSLPVNADDIARERHMDPYEAAIEAEKRRNEALERKESFVVETVLSIPAKIDFLKKAKAFGYIITLIFVTTQDPLINIGRVAERVRMGGHSVPREKTLNRYKRSMKLLPQALDVADTAVVYDNSFDQAVRIAKKTIENEVVIYPQQSPGRWSTERIRKLLGVKTAVLQNQNSK